MSFARGDLVLLREGHAPLLQTVISQPRQVLRKADLVTNWVEQSAVNSVSDADAACE